MTDVLSNRKQPEKKGASYRSTDFSPFWYIRLMWDGNKPNIQDAKRMNNGTIARV